MYLFLFLCLFSFFPFCSSGCGGGDDGSGTCVELADLGGIM
jgi:hypothetical protein